MNDIVYILKYLNIPYKVNRPWYVQAIVIIQANKYTEVIVYVEEHTKDQPRPSYFLDFVDWVKNKTLPNYLYEILR